ncbi:MAG TPA: hypothetical protein VFK05_26835 [Polyangiaceae bacterium]|nr:hypothetical protein [Polyangiaceae bacterium]
MFADARPSRLRLGVLLALLVLTLLWAVYEVRSRRARNEWQRPLEVAVAFVQLGAVDAEALEALRGRFPLLEKRLGDEYHRYGGRLPKPIHFTLFGPVMVDRAPPTDPSDTLLGLAQHAYEQWRWTRAVDIGSRLPSRDFDSRIYLFLRAPQDSTRGLVEGSSELGGRVGVARIELAATTVDLGLFVVSHELFHTLGASDKYDMHGRAVIPEGLVEPERVPLYPQRYAEVMTRNLVVAAGTERPPDSLAELGVGRLTAREIGWSSSELPK